MLTYHELWKKFISDNIASYRQHIDVELEFLSSALPDKKIWHFYLYLSMRDGVGISTLKEHQIGLEKAREELKIEPGLWEQTFKTKIPLFKLRSMKDAYEDLKKEDPTVRSMGDAYSVLKKRSMSRFETLTPQKFRCLETYIRKTTFCPSELTANTSDAIKSAYVNMQKEIERLVEKHPVNLSHIETATIWLREPYIIPAPTPKAFESEIPAQEKEVMVKLMRPIIAAMPQAMAKSRSNTIEQDILNKHGERTGRQKKKKYKERKYC